jgi:glucose-1-phosphate adenylyltransferase
VKHETESTVGSPRSDHRTNVLALVLAGGSGTRLGALTAWRCKPALPFGGQFRTIDFPLSNCVNSGIRQIALLVQYKAQSLIRHVQAGWSFLHRELGEYVDVWPAQQQLGERWYLGNVDAVHQNLDLVAAVDPQYVLILSGTQIYSMDYSLLIEEHIAAGADLTVGTVELPDDEPGLQPLVSTDRRARVRRVLGGPLEHLPCRDRDRLRALMGVYLFDARYLLETVTADARDPASLHDFTVDLLPAAVANGRVLAHDFRDRTGRGPGYWRDLRTVDDYWQAHMDLLEDPPRFDAYDPTWPIWTHQTPAGPARIATSGHMSAALLGRGCVVAGEVARSVLGTDCTVGLGSRVTHSVLMPDVRIGSRCSLDHVVIDRGCEIPDNTVIGANASSAEHDVSPDGVVVITRNRRGRGGRSAVHAKVA